jgi:hypothetical protein
MRLVLDRTVLLDHVMAEGRQLGAPPAEPPCFVSTTGVSKSLLSASTSSHARRYDIPIERPAAEIDPWSRTASSNRILPWPIARPGPVRSRDAT